MAELHLPQGLHSSSINTTAAEWMLCHLFHSIILRVGNVFVRCCLSRQCVSCTVVLSRLSALGILLRIRWCCCPCSFAFEGKCENLEPYLQYFHNQLLREKLINVAKENKGKSVCSKLDNSCIAVLCCLLQLISFVASSVATPTGYLRLLSTIY